MICVERDLPGEAYEHNDQAIVRCVNTDLLLDVLTERDAHPMHTAI